MAGFDPKNLKPASKSAEFSKAAGQRTARDVLLAGIDTQLALFKDPTATKRRWFRIGQKEIAFTLRIQNQPLKLLGDETEVVVPVDQFENAMKFYEQEIKAGKFDDQLKVAGERMAARKEKMVATRAANKTQKD